MACVQGTWWGAGGGVVGGWWGSWIWCQVSGWGWVPGLGCLVGGGVRPAGPGSRGAGGWRGSGSVPLRPLLNSPPGRLVCCGSWFGSSLCRAVASVVRGCRAGCSSFLRGWAGLAGGLSRWWCSGRLVLNLGEWLLFSLVVQVRSRVRRGLFRGCGLRGLCPCRGVVLGGVCRSRWAGRPGRSGSPSPPFPPIVHDEASQTPGTSG
jgi:hypothetical protein